MGQEQTIVTWGSIRGREVHDAGGREGLGNLMISLETGLMMNSTVRLPSEGIDFIIIGVPADKRKLIEQHCSDVFGRSLNGRI